MLDPADRVVLTDLLCPPPGFQLDRVVATTYTLDLVALMALPLSFTLIAGDGMNEAGHIDPIALLEALRRHAGRITVFCDAGRIAVPARGELLFGYLEESVVEAQAPGGGAFHPKVIIVRYTADPNAPVWDGEERPEEGAIRYRLLCGTRNLTFDRSWDTMLALDGELVTGRTRAFARNHPLSRFVKALPGFAVRPMPDSKAASIGQIADELLRVSFEPPEGFGIRTEDLAFWPIGLDQKEVWPFWDCTDRLLAVSPFVDKTFIEWILEKSEFCAIVSRPEELDRVPTETLGAIGSCYILADAADAEPSETDSTPPPEESESDNRPGDVRDRVTVEPSASPLRGLHAKLFIADAGWDARLWTGSANATRAAFEKNVEFLIELRGKKARFGTDALMGASGSKEGQVRFRDLLTPYQPPEKAVKEEATRKKLERLLDEGRRALVDAGLVARVVERDQAEKQPYDVSVESTAEEGSRLPTGVEGTIRPISLSRDAGAPVTALSGQLARFPSLMFEWLTEFWAVTLTAKAEGQRLTQDFVLRIPLVGAPSDRENRLLLAMLSNRERLLRYLLMLLEGTEAALRNMDGNGSGGEWNNVISSGPFGLPLLEPLLQTLATDPSRLDHVERLVRDLEATEEGRKLLPEDFVSVWESIRSVIPGPQKQKEDADART